MRLLIKNAQLFDGEDPKSRPASVMLEGDKIADVLAGPPEGYEGETLDIGGACLAPGFIDTHSHNDFYAVLPDADRYNRSFVRQGITTMVAGQCGFSMLGVDPDTPYASDLFAFFAKNPDFAAVTDFEGWRAAIDRFSPVNMACFCGHGTLRTAIRGLGDAPLTADEMDDLERRVDAQLAAGAAGVSFGLMYDPSMYGAPEELLRLAKLAQKHGKPVSYHTRAMSKVSMAYPQLLGRPHNLRALDEVVDIAEKTGVRTHISHLIFVGRQTWATAQTALDLIDGAARKGLEFSFDIYPFDFGASTITVVLPAWYQSLSPQQRKKPAVRLRLNAEIFATKKLLGFEFDDICITWAGPAHPEYIGKRVSEIAREKNQKPLETYLQIVEEGGVESTVIMYAYTNEQIVNTLTRHPDVHYMTDAWIVDEGMQNPASYHSFPCFLRLSREGRAEELGRMICKMTGGAAARFGLAGRGLVKPGHYADLVVFDKETVREGEGEGPPAGLPHVLINGEFAVRDGVYLEKNLGRGIG